MTNTLPRADAEPGETGGPQRPRLPEIPGPLETAKRAWRRLRRMSTALMLLFCLAAAAVVATFVPQEPVVAPTVEQWRAGEAGPGAGWATVFDAVGLFDIFGSWWFAAITVLLFVSLTGCLIPRWRGFLVSVRRRPVAGRNLSRLSNQATWDTELPPDRALEVAESALRRRWFRRRRLGADETASGRPQLAAERGHAREGGSLVFHTAFYVLLIGAVIGEVFGFTGQINLVEGESFAETRIAYDLAEPGRAFDVADHRGFTATLDDFEVSYFDDGTPRSFVSDVTITEGGEQVRSGDVRVNEPFVVQGMKLYQARFGMAPRVVVRAADTTTFDDEVILTRDGPYWTGAAKVSVGNAAQEIPQVALDLVFVPDAEITDSGRLAFGGPQPQNPRLAVSLYAGDDLGLGRARPVSEFNRDAGQLVGEAMLRPGETAGFADGRLTVGFPELSMWSGFQVKHSPGRWVLLASAVMVLAGLVPSLYSYRRRVWVEARRTDAGSAVTVAGAALQRKGRFVEEFAGIAESLRRAHRTPSQPTTSQSPPSDGSGPAPETASTGHEPATPAGAEPTTQSGS
jgi:cytochrome c biogenesis protein